MASSCRCRTRQKVSRCRSLARFSGSRPKLSRAPIVSRASANSARLTSTDSEPATRQSSSPSISGKCRFSGGSSLPRAIPSATVAVVSSAPEDTVWAMLAGGISTRGPLDHIAASGPIPRLFQLSKASTCAGALPTYTAEPSYRPKLQHGIWTLSLPSTTLLPSTNCSSDWNHPGNVTAVGCRPSIP